MVSFLKITPSLTLPRFGGGKLTRSVFLPSPKMGEGQGGGISPRAVIGDISC